MEWNELLFITGLVEATPGAMLNGGKPAKGESIRVNVDEDEREMTLQYRGYEDVYGLDDRELQELRRKDYV